MSTFLSKSLCWSYRFLKRICECLNLKMNCLFCKSKSELVGVPSLDDEKLTPNNNDKCPLSVIFQFQLSLTTVYINTILHWNCLTCVSRYWTHFTLSKLLRVALFHSYGSKIRSRTFPGNVQKTRNLHLQLYKHIS